MGSKRPYVICHMMSTIDGKIASGTGVDILEDYFSLYTQTEDKLECKNWLIGRVTMEMFADSVDTPLPALNQEVNDKDYLVPNTSQPFMFAVDSKGKLRWKDNSIKLSNVTEKLHLVVIITKETSKEYIAYLQDKQISYIFGGDKEIDFTKTLEKISERFGVEKLLLEGGGILNGSLMVDNLVDEISLLVTPKVLNKSNAPSVFERQTDEIVTKDYSLIEVTKTDKDCVWLRYKKV